MVVNAFQSGEMRIAQVNYRHLGTLHSGPEAVVTLDLHRDYPNGWTLYTSTNGDLYCDFQREEVQSMMSDLCTMRGVRHWVKVWFARTVRRRWQRDASLVMLHACLGCKPAMSVVHSFL